MRVRKNRKNLREALIVGAGAGSFKTSLKGGQHIMGYRGFNESETKELSWDDFSDPVTDRIEKEFLPANGEGDSMMSQAVTATTKLIYKWFNDGDVFDNTFGLQGWANDLSDYANWLDENIPEAASILERIKEVGSDESAYTQLLFDLMHAVFNDEMIVKYADKPVVGTIYDCSGPYSFYTAPTCPECGQECDDWDYQHYGMCSDCYNQQWEESEEEVGSKAHQTSEAHVMQILNGVRILDWMIQRKDVDKTRIGVNGGSGGGTQTVLLSVIDNRFTASCPVVSMSAWFDGGCPCESGKPIQLAGGGTCNAELAAAFAPKPMMVVSDGGDWTSETPKSEYPYLQRIYGFYDQKEHVKNIHLPKERHDFGPNKRNAVYEFFIETFSLDRAMLDEDKVTIETENALRYNPKK